MTRVHWRDQHKMAFRMVKAGVISLSTLAVWANSVVLRAVRRLFRW